MGFYWIHKNGKWNAKEVYFGQNNKKNNDKVEFSKELKVNMKSEGTGILNQKAGKKE